MKYTEIINGTYNGEPQKLALVGEAWGGGPTTILQIQVEQDGSDCSIDIDIIEAKALHDKLTEWLKFKNVI